MTTPDAWVVIQSQFPEEVELSMLYFTGILLLVHIEKDLAQTLLQGERKTFLLMRGWGSFWNSYVRWLSGF